MKQRIKILSVILFALLFPLLLNPFSDLIDRLSFSILNETGREFLQHFAIDKSTYLTILSIEATALVAYAIYWMQRRAEKEKEKEQKERIKNALFSTLVASLKEVHTLSRLDLYEEQEYRFIRISEKHFEAISEVNGLEEADISLLHNILKELECLVEHEKEDELGDIRLHTDKLISNIMIPAYVQYKYDVEEPKDAFEMMNEQLLSILRNFDYAPNSKGKTQYFSKDGNIVIKYDAEGKAIVYNNAGEKVCNAFIDKKGIREGWAILYRENSPLYKGEWANYKKHGKGIEYLADYDDNLHIAMEGIWNEGNLWDGVIYDVLVHSDGTLIDGDVDGIIQINKQFHYNEASFIKNLETYSVANIIVKEGEPMIDSNSTPRDVKSTYESKYGVVEWSDSYSYEEVNAPDINVLINETNELNLAFNPAIEINRLPLPLEILESDITSHLCKYVTEEEVEAYNAKIPDIIKKIEVYNKDLETYKYAEAFGVELNLSIINDGNLKANDIHIVLDLPDEILILEGSKENLEEPEVPNLPHNPIDKAMSKITGFGAVQSAAGLIGRMGVGTLLHSDVYKNDRLLRNFITSSNPNYWTHLDGKTIKVHCAELLHTKKRIFDSEYLLVPTKAGTYDINISVICEEYVEEDAFTIQIIVEGE